MLGRGAAAHRRRRRDPDPARRHAARACRSRTSTATTCSTWTSSPTAATRCRSSGSRARSPRRPAAQVRLPGASWSRRGAAPSTAERLAVDVRDPDLCTAVRRPLGERRDRRPVARPRPDAAPRRRPAAGLQRRRRLELRDARARQADPHVRRRRVHRRRPTAAPRSSSAARWPGSGSRPSTTSSASSPRDMLLIADADGPIGIAGVMGGATSEVSDATTDVVDRVGDLRPGEHPADGPAARAALRGEQPLREGPGAAAGADRRRPHRPARPPSGRAASSPAGASTPRPTSPGRSRVTFRPARINRLLGTELPADEQRDAARAGRRSRPSPRRRRAGRRRAAARSRWSSIAGATGRGPAVAALVPTWRRDVAIEADVAEEIARVRGYELVAVRHARHRACRRFRPSPLEVRELVRETLAGAGLTEVVTTALVSPAPPRDVRPARARCRRSATSRSPVASPSPSRNPLSRDHSVLRRNLLGSLLDVVGVNLRHGTRRRRGVRDRQGLRAGRRRAARVVAPRRSRSSAPAEPPAWNRPARPYDLDDAKGLLELLAARLGLGSVRPTRPEPGEAVFHPGRTARAEHRRPPRRRSSASSTRRSSTPGSSGPRGRGHRRRGRHRGPRGGAAGARSARPRSGRFPEVERDLAIVVPEATPAAAVEASIRAPRRRAARATSRLFDIYRGVPLAPDEKSLAFRLRLGAPDRTLTEAEVEGAVAAIVAGAAGGRRAGSAPDARPIGRIARARARTGCLAPGADRVAAPDRRAATLRAESGPERAGQPSRGYCVEHRRHPDVRSTSFDVLVILYLFGLFILGFIQGTIRRLLGIAVDRVLVLPRAASSTRCGSGNFLADELDAVPQGVLGHDRVPRDLHRRRSSRSRW